MFLCLLREDSACVAEVEEEAMKQALKVRLAYVGFMAFACGVVTFVTIAVGMFTVLAFMRGGAPAWLVGLSWAGALVGAGIGFAVPKEKL
jgi:hypothetical protein